MQRKLVNSLGDQASINPFFRGSNVVTFLRELLSRETSLFPLSTSNFEPLLELLFLHPPGSRLSRLNAQGEQVQCCAWQAAARAFEGTSCHDDSSFWLSDISQSLGKGLA